MRKNAIYIFLLIAIIILGSCAVKDSRLEEMERAKAQEELEAKRQVETRIKMAAYFTKPTVVDPKAVEDPEEADEETIEAEGTTYEEECKEETIYWADGEPMTYLGTFEVTAYEWTGNPCANGNYPSEGYTVACNSLPLGSTVYIDGCGYYVVEDRGASWHGDNWLDLYLGDEDACWNWGIQYRDVYLVG